MVILGWVKNKAFTELYCNSNGVNRILFNIWMFGRYTQTIPIVWVWVFVCLFGVMRPMDMIPQHMAFCRTTPELGSLPSFIQTSGQVKHVKHCQTVKPSGNIWKTVKISGQSLHPGTTECRPPARSPALCAL